MRLRWRHECAFTPSWLDVHADLVVAAGGDRVICLGKADGLPIWELSAPALADFRLVGPRLYCLQDSRMLLAIESESGAVAWHAWAPAARLQLPYPAGCFAPPYHADDNGVLIQTTGGRTIFIEARQGQAKDLGDNPWTRPPVAVGCNRVCLVLDPNLLVMIDSASGKELWRHAIDRPASLDGRAPQLLGEVENLFVLTFRNYGSFLECFDARTGHPGWPEARFLGSESVDLQHGLADASAVYLTRENALEAWALRDGSRLWRQPLPAPGGSWRALRDGEEVLVYPHQPLFSEYRLLSWSPEFAGIWPVEAPSGTYVPLLFHDATTGRLVRRLNLYAESCVPGGRGLALALPPIRRSQAQLNVQSARQGMIVTLASTVWGLRPEPR
jgi:outer membrane protein assembly factor BamB